MPRPKKRPAPPATIAEMVGIAATLLCLPGGILYFLTVAAVANGWLEITDNLLLLMMLALAGFGLFVLAVVGLTATILHGWRQKSFRGLPRVSLFVQGGIILVMLLLWGSGWQIG